MPTIGQTPHRFRTTITKSVSLNYLLFLPSSYGKHRRERWPLMLFLHGAGEKMSSNEKF